MAATTISTLESPDLAWQMHPSKLSVVKAGQGNTYALVRVNPAD